ncbi:hypothetical protein [Acidovorax facilis]
MQTKRDCKETPVLERVVDYFLQFGRLRSAGRFLTHVSVYLCIFGAAAHCITAVPAALQHRSAQTLAEVLPNLPSWWVPEHPVSFVVVIAFGLLGVFLSLKGKQVDRYLSA